MSNLIDKCTKRLDEHLRCMQMLDIASITNIGIGIAIAVSLHKRIFVCGNGGSAADAQHFAAEIVGRFEQDRLPWGCTALTTDSSIVTAIGNDYGYDKIFERQIEGLGKSEDVLIGISTSGKSPNVINALNKAQRMGLTTVALFGRNNTHNQYHHCLNVDCGNTARVQEAHIFILHLWAEIIETVVA
jgi:D-sedoheptulose 7-phosphate isomerase